jgi:LmbE family N-acetylglucosaminyl deacetylase
VLLALVGAAFIAYRYRTRAYRLHVFCPPQKDYEYDFEDSGCIEIPICIGNTGCELPAIARAYTTGILALRVESTAVGRWRDAALEIGTGAQRHQAFFERGVCGKRYVDLSPFLATAGWLPLRGSGAYWRPQQGVLRLWTDPVKAADRVLIVAPHPDDAEIAASSFYSHPQTWILNVTSGRKLHWKLGKLFPHGFDENLASSMRVWDSLAVPWLGGVSPQRCIQLAYPDDALNAMREEPDKDWLPLVKNFSHLRTLNMFSGLRLRERCNWNGMVGDLEDVICQLRPDVVVLPCPRLDGHGDHKAVSYAIKEAIDVLSIRVPKFLLYVNHAEEAELWPYGPKGAGMTLPPVTGAPYPVFGVYSRPLSAEERNLKFLMLEAMHDLREPPQPGLKSWLQLGQEFKAELGARLKGLDRLPNNYFRRAVRTNEIFFVANRDQLRGLLSSKSRKGKL